MVTTSRKWVGSVTQLINFKLKKGWLLDFPRRRSQLKTNQEPCLLSGYPAIQLGYRRIFAKFEDAKNLIIPSWLSGARWHLTGIIARPIRTKRQRSVPKRTKKV